MLQRRYSAHEIYSFKNQNQKTIPTHRQIPWQSKVLASKEGRWVAMASGWEMDVHSSIYNRILNPMRVKFPSAKVVMYEEADTPSQFPFIFVNMLAPSEQARDLQGNSVNGGLFTFQIDVYSTNAEEAKKIMREISSIMKSMSFEIISMPSFDRQDGLRRCTARFRRLICAKDKGILLGT